MAAKLVKDPAAHPWSGHSALIGHGPAILVDVGPALVGFGETLEQSREAYLKQVRLVTEAKWFGAGVRKLPWWEKVSNDDHLGFSVADVADLLQKHPGSVSRWLKTPQRTDGHDTTVSAILETAAELGCDMKKM